MSYIKNSKLISEWAITLTAFHHAMDNIRAAIDQRKVSILDLFNFAKAFIDTVDLTL